MVGFDRAAGAAAFGAAARVAAVVVVGLLVAVTPARAVVLPLVTIMFHRQNLLLRLYEVLLIRSAFHEFFV